MCISYHNEPVGLKSLTEISDAIWRRFVFSCKCPTHLETRPLLPKGVMAPSSIPVICFKNKGAGNIANVLASLDKAFNDKEWLVVQAICEEAYRV